VIGFIQPVEPSENILTFLERASLAPRTTIQLEFDWDVPEDSEESDEDYL
jgi:hypothetical protein